MLPRVSTLFNSISIAFTAVNPPPSHGFRARLRPTLFNQNFLQDFEFVHELQLFPPCDLHGLWTQPLARDVVTDCSRIFQLSTQQVLLHMRFQLLSNSANRFFSTGPLNPCDDCCHKFLWADLSISLEHTQPFRHHWRTAQPCRRFCVAAHVHRHFHSVFFA